MKKIILTTLVLAFLASSCSKPKGNESCVWETQTTGMICGICKMSQPNEYKQYKCNNLDSLDTCKYNLFMLSTYFNLKHLPHEVCSNPTDSIVGTIEKIFIVCNNNYNQNFKEGDTLNPIIKVVYQKYLSGFTETPIMLNDYLNSNPICTGYINFLLDQPPDTTSIQSFKIIYQESTGSKYECETVPVYITL